MNIPKDAILPGAPIGAVSTSLPAVVDEAAAASVRTAVARTDYPAESDAFAEALERQALAEVAAAHAPPLDESSTIDRWSVDAVGELAGRVTRAESAHDAAEAKREECERKRAALPSPMSWWAALFYALFSLGLATLATLAVVRLLEGGVDIYLLRPHLVETYQDAGVALAARYAFLTSLGVVGTLTGVQVLLMLLTWGRIRLGIKIAFVVTDLLFSAFFAVLRSKEEAWTESIAAGGFELVPLLALTWFVLDASKRLSADADLRQPYRLAKAELRAAEVAAVHASVRLEAAQGALAAQVAVVERRELDHRMLPARRELAAATVRATYLTEVAALVSRAAMPAQDDSYTAMLDDELKATHARHRDTVEENAKQ